MSHLKEIEQETLPDAYQDEYSKTVFGFWLYLLTDFMMFATIFAVYAVLRKNTLGGPGAQELFDLNSVMSQTWVFLLGTFFIGLGGASAHRRNRKQTILYFILTFLLGIVFLFLMSVDLSQMIQKGSTWRSNGFLSAYFTLVGTFAVHVIFALLWIVILLVPLMCHRVNPVNVRRLTCLRMFWQFLNIIWIFIFSIVYLLGAIT